MPDYALGSHVAALGLTQSAGNTLSAQFAEGMFIGQHGSWNRERRSGKAHGRPVGVAIDRRGELLVADDVGNIIWRVTAAGGE